MKILCPPPERRHAPGGRHLREAERVRRPDGWIVVWLGHKDAAAPAPSYRHGMIRTVMNRSDWATMLALAAMQIEPKIRLPHAINWALHKRWIGIDGKGRAMLAVEGRSTGRVLYETACKGGALAAGRQGGAIAVGHWADLMALDLGW